MSFQARQPTTYTSTLENDGFFPDLELAYWQKIFRIDDRLPEETLLDLLLQACLSVNTDLQAWQCRQVNQGYLSLEAVPANQVGGKSHLAIWYQSAVYNRATADYLVQFADYATTEVKETGKAENRVEAKQQHATTHYRNAIAAIERIKGRSDTYVRLV